MPDIPSTGGGHVTEAWLLDAFAVSGETAQRAGSRTLSETEPPKRLMALQIIGHAQALLVTEGYARFSVRKVATAAGVSQGHLQHYFPKRADLLHAMVDVLSMAFMHHYERRIAILDHPKDRLAACAGLVLGCGPAPDILPLFREFWSMAAHDHVMAETLVDFYTASRRLLARVMKEVNPDLSVTQARLQGATAVSMLAGAFLYAEPWQSVVPLKGFHRHITEVVLQLPFSASC